MDNEEYEELLEEYEDDDYVYIVDTFIGKYVTTEEPDLYYCESCGSYDSIEISGYVNKIVNREPQNKRKVIRYTKK